MPSDTNTKPKIQNINTTLNKWHGLKFVIEMEIGIWMLSVRFNVYVGVCCYALAKSIGIVERCADIEFGMQLRLVRTILPSIPVC